MKVQDGYCIYIINNIVNNKIYIGQTKSFRKRKTQHMLATGKDNYMIVDRAINRHGKDKFEMDLIEYCNSFKDMNDAEEFWIAYYKSIGAELYNIKKGGDNKEISQETRNKMSLSHIGKVNSPEARIKISKAKKGMLHSEESKNKISKANTGKIRSDEAKEKMRKARIGRINTLETRKLMSESSPLKKPIICIDKFGNETYFISTAEACLKLNLSRSGIKDVLSGRQNKTGDNFKFRFAALLEIQNEN